MVETTENYLRHYLENLQVNLFIAQYTQVPATWKDSSHVIAFNKLYLIEEGEGVIIINKKPYYPKKGDMVFIPAGSEISFSTISSKSYLKYWCHFSATIGTTPLSEFFTIPVIVQIPEVDKIRQIFGTMIEHFNQPSPFSPIMAHACLMELIYWYFHHLELQQLDLTSSLTHTKLYTLIAYIMNHLHEKLTVEKLANYMNLNPNYLIRLFSSQFGMTPMEYVNTQRIHQAKHLLQLPGATVSQTASRLGFSSPYYFSTVFKKITGLSPRAYQQQVAT